MTDQIFISYSKKDSDFAHKLADDLAAAGFKIWIDDKSISGGNLWRETIEQNLKLAGEVIVVVSPNSMTSEWVMLEGTLAYGWEKQLFPILIQPVENLPPWLEEYQWIDFVSTPHKIAFDSLVNALTPPDPIRDLLDQQFQAYQQTGALMGEIILSVIEDNIDIQAISAEKRELIELSRLQASKAKRRRQLYILLGILFFSVALVLTTLGVTGNLSRLIYRPLPMEMVEIPAGTFLMGSAITDPIYEEDELPQRNVYLDTYKIGKTEVTKKQYRQCIKAGVCRTISPLEFLETDQENFPVTFVDWEDATAFCRWYGYRLPTEAEWEKAARGENDGRIFPWGDQLPDCERTTLLGCTEGPVPVGEHEENASPYGVLDMSGNVWEWVADWYGSDYYAIAPNVNPPGPATREENNYYRVLRGGAATDKKEQLRIANRRGDSPDTRNHLIGFRCVQDVSP